MSGKIDNGPGLKKYPVNPPLTEAEAAEYLGVAIQTLRNWRSIQKAGSPPYLKLSTGPRGRVVYLLEDLQNYRSQCRIDPNSELA